MPAPRPATVTTLNRATPPRADLLLPSLQSRLRERTRAARRALWRRMGLVVLVAALAVTLGWAAFLSPLFALDPAKVTVDAPEGAVDPAVIREVVDSHAAVPLPRLDASALAARLEEEPGIRTVAVERAWPRGLVVTVEPRVPAAAVPAEDGVALFDAEGVRVGVVQSPPEGIPVVDIPLGEDTPRTLMEALAVLAALPDDLRSQVVDVSARNADSIALVLADGATVRWGGNSENELKASVLATLRQVPAGLYDVSTPRRPITR